MCAKHAAQFDQATISASNAVAPCPLACTISGLTSISVSSGTVCISRPMAMTTCATAAMSAGGAPRKPVSSLAVRSLCNASTICAFVRVDRQKLHVAQRLDPDAAEAEQQHRTPAGIALGTHHQLNPFRRHLFDEGAIERDAGRSAFDVFDQCVPGGAHRAFIGKIQDDAARFGLVRQRRGLRLQHHRIADALGRCDRFVGRAGKFAVGHPNASGCENLLA